MQICCSEKGWDAARETQARRCRTEVTMKRSKRMIAAALFLTMVLCGAQSVSAAPVYSELSTVADTLYAVKAEPGTIHVGDSVQLQVVTGRSTTHVQVYDQNGGLVAQATDGAVDKSGRLYWTVSFSISQVGEKSFQVVAGNRYVDSANREITISVLSNVPKPVVTAVELKNTSAYCTVENYPDLAKVRLELRDTAGNVVYEDYQNEKLEAGTYTVTAYVRDDPYGTASEPYAFQVTQSEVDAYRLLRDARVVIVANEGTYTTVIPDDNNALSIGCLGWHATRAHDLVKNMLVQDPKTVESHLTGSSMLDELHQTNYIWNNRILTSSEASIMRGLLATDVSKTVQDATAEEDISAYLVYGRNRGITEEGALIYYADLYNQSPKRAREILEAIQEDGKALNLDNFHAYALENPVMGKYTYRRNLTYNTLKKLGYV